MSSRPTHTAATRPLKGCAHEPKHWRWADCAKAIRKSRKGCDCPNEIDGKRVPPSDRCSAKWIRCNGAVRARNKAFDRVGWEKPHAG